MTRRTNTNKNEATEKEKEFVIKILEIAQEYENSDFDIVDSLSKIFSIIFITRKRNKSVNVIIESNKKKWGIE